MTDLTSIPTDAEMRWLELVHANHGNFRSPLPRPEEHLSCWQKRWITQGGNNCRINPSGLKAMDRYRSSKGLSGD